MITATWSKADASSRLVSACAELAAGRPVILHSEYISEFVAVGENLSPKCVNTMVSDGRGVLRLALPAGRCRQLRVEPQGVVYPGETWTGVSIEAKVGITTGISAADRALTVSIASRIDASADDLARPGHVIPIATHDRGVLSRPRLEESAVDLMVDAGFAPAAALCQVLNDEGELARAAEARELARRGGYLSVEVDDIVELYRERARYPVLERLSIVELAQGRIYCCSYCIPPARRWQAALLAGACGERQVASRVIPPKRMAALLRGGMEADGLVRKYLAEGAAAVATPFPPEDERSSVAGAESALEVPAEVVEALAVDTVDWNWPRGRRDGR